jgi:hypothetical protein
MEGLRELNLTVSLLYIYIYIYIYYNEYVCWFNLTVIFTIIWSQRWANAPPPPGT